MKIELLSDLLISLVRDNPSWEPLSKQNLESYYQVLEPIPDDVFDKAALHIRRQRYYRWPGAGEIYQICQTFMESEGQRLFTKTINFVRENPDNASRHDEWQKVHPIFKKLLGSSWEGALLNLNERTLEQVKDQFVILFDGGL
jgi:hypothetical protein